VANAKFARECEVINLANIERKLTL